MGIEAVSYFLVGLPWSEGLTMTLSKLRAIHTSPWSMFDNLAIFATGFVSQVGLPLLLAIVVGWGAVLWGAWRREASRRDARLVVGLGVPLGLLYLWLSGTMPFFRQTSTVQPFLFLFASLGIVALVQRLAAGRAARAGLVAALIVLVGVVPWTQAAAVFQAHQSLGRALEWAYANRGDHALHWLQIAWFGGQNEVLRPADLAQLPDDSWLMSYYPVSFVDSNPRLQPALARRQQSRRGRHSTPRIPYAWSIEVTGTMTGGPTRCSATFASSKWARCGRRCRVHRSRSPR